MHNSGLLDAGLLDYSKASGAVLQIVFTPAVAQQQCDHERIPVLAFQNVRRLTYQSRKGLVDCKFVQEECEYPAVQRRIKSSPC